MKTPTELCNEIWIPWGWARQWRCLCGGTVENKLENCWNKEKMGWGMGVMIHGGKVPLAHPAD